MGEGCHGRRSRMSDEEWRLRNERRMEGSNDNRNEE